MRKHAKLNSLFRERLQTSDFLVISSFNVQVSDWGVGHLDCALVQLNWEVGIDITKLDISSY